MLESVANNASRNGKPNTDKTKPKNKTKLGISGYWRDPSRHLLRRSTGHSQHGMHWQRPHAAIRAEM